MRGNVQYLDLAYRGFYKVADEILSDAFWKKRKYYRFCKIKEAFSIYVELLNYPSISLIIDSFSKNRPPMEAEIGTEVFKFVRNVIIHFPFFQSWEDVWVNKDVVNWYKESLSIDKFLKKYEGHDFVKYRIWEGNKKKMTYITINFPSGYSKKKKIFLKDILSEKDGVKFSVILMHKILHAQGEEWLKLRVKK